MCNSESKFRLFCIKILNILSFWKTSVYQELIKTVFMFSYWACCVLECDHKKTMRNYFYMNFMTIWNLLSHPRREMMIIFKCCLKSPWFFVYRRREGVAHVRRQRNGRGLGELSRCNWEINRRRRLWPDSERMWSSPVRGRRTEPGTSRLTSHFS